jgi:opacity protein-like surface antigen
MATIICAPVYIYGYYLNQNSSETSATEYIRESNRTVRRLLVEGSLTNIGYEGKDAARDSKVNGYTVGLLFDLFGSFNFVLETGALYRQLGITIDDRFGDSALPANYVSIPISGKYYFTSQNETSAYLKAGALESAMVSKNISYTKNEKVIKARTWETAMLVGLGIKTKLTSQTDVLFEGDYTRALESMFYDSSVYRSELSATIGIGINL